MAWGGIVMPKNLKINKMKKNISAAKKAVNNEALSQEMKCHSLNKVIETWFEVNTKNIDFGQLTIEICQFIEDELDDHVFGNGLVKFKKQIHDGTKL